MSRIKELPVVFKNDGMQIVGMLHSPDTVTDGKPPAVVFFHGCTTTKTESHWLFVKLARALAERGIMVLRFDFRYSGDSEGDFENMTVSGEISDALKSVEYLISECGADESRIGILGMSMGGAIGAITAGRLTDRIKACVLLNPVGKLFEDLNAIASSNNLNTTTFPIEWNSRLFGREFFEDMVNINPLEEIENATCPILIINGSEDKSVSPVRSKEYYDIACKKDRNAELMVIDGADHVFNTVKWERDIIQKVSGWYENLLLTV
jgi:uncharacterized protein